MEEMGFLPRSIRRGADALLYFKQSEHIEDFLTKIGAPAAAMDIMTAKVDKEIRNGANRAMNCDMANVNKTLDAAQEQVGAIEAAPQRPVGYASGKAAANRGAAAGISGVVAGTAGREVRPAGNKVVHEPSNEKVDGGG